MCPLLAAPPGLPHPATPRTYSTSFPKRAARCPPSAGSPHPAPNPPKPPRSPPTCPGLAATTTTTATMAERALDPLPHLRRPRRAPRASPHPRGDAAQQTQAGWPCPNPACAAPAMPSPERSSRGGAAAVAVPARGQSPRGVRMGTAWLRDPPVSCSKGRGSINHDPPSPAKWGGLSAASPMPLPHSLRPRCHPVKIWEATSDVPQTPRAMRSPVPTQPGQSVCNPPRAPHRHPPGSPCAAMRGAGMGWPQKPPSPPALLCRSLPRALQLLPLRRATRQAELWQAAPQEQGGSPGAEDLWVPWGSPPITGVPAGPHSRAKSSRCV